MKYLSVCSGIEAATVAWHDMGWDPVGFSEIESFPSAVLKHHYPEVKNLGDMTKYKEWDIDSIGLLVGGTPCQSFSVAGLRKGLEDPRGNLMLTYCGILDKFRPKWFIWENVPGVLSSGGGRDFGSFLGAVAELGYGFAYRVLDAQHFGVAQRRRRVFVVGCLGDWRSAAEVLFESDCLRRDTAKGRKTGKETTTSFVPSLANCLQTTSNDYSRADGFNMIAYESHPADSRIKEMGETCQTVTSRWGTGGGNVPLVQPIAFTSEQTPKTSVNLAHTLTNTTYKHNQCVAFEPGIAKREGGDSRFVEEMSPTLRKEMGDNQVAVAYSVREDAKANTFSATELEVSNAIGALRPSPQSHHAQVFVAQPMAVGVDTYNGTIQGNITTTMTADMAGPTHSGPKIMQNMAVRRLTPMECERLQGFPDGYTMIPWKKGESPDGLRYKALGNSMAVPCMKWIGERINEINQQT